MLALLIGASTAFATPIGYQTNLMVLTPGGYRCVAAISFAQTQGANARLRNKVTRALLTHFHSHRQRWRLLAFIKQLTTVVATNRSSLLLSNYPARISPYPPPRKQAFNHHFPADRL
eukprot:3334284-Pleurochrysis_carterae.AAC.1